MASQKEKQSVMNQLESFYENMSEKKEAKLLGLMAFFMNEINKLQDEHGYSSTKDRLDRGQQLPNPTKVTSLIDDSLTASCILQQFASKLHAHKKAFQNKKHVKQLRDFYFTYYCSIWFGILLVALPRRFVFIIFCNRPSK